MSGTVTVTRTTQAKTTDAIRDTRFRLTFSALPGQTFGPYGYQDARGDLLVAALLSPADARNLLLDAMAVGEATAETQR